MFYAFFFYLVRIFHFRPEKLNLLLLVYVCLLSRSRKGISSLMLLKELADALLASTLEFGDLSAVFVHLEGWHTIDASCLGDFCCCVYVDLSESPTSVFWLC